MDPKSYRRIDWSTTRVGGSGTTADANAVKKFDAEGDHLTIVRVMGSHPVYVRLGDESNPFIQVFSRMVLRRQFDRVTFADGGLNGSRPGGASSAWDLSGKAGGSRVLAYVSTGPLVEAWPPKEYGIRRSPVFVNGLVATTTRQEILSEMLVGPSVLDKACTAGLDGGTLLIKNTGSADIYLEAGTGSSPNFALFSGSYGFPLSPGESFELQLEDLVFAYVGAPNGGGITVKTLAGTSTFALALSSGEFNSAEPLQGVVDPQGIL